MHFCISQDGYPKKALALRFSPKQEQEKFKVTGYPKKTQTQYILAFHKINIQKRAFQDYANDVRIIILTSLNFAQIRKKGSKNAKVTIPGIGSASATKKIGYT